MDAPLNTCPVCRDELAYLGPSFLCMRHRLEYERCVEEWLSPRASAPATFGSMAAAREDDE